jgi:hypothetical protein
MTTEHEQPASADDAREARLALLRVTARLEAGRVVMAYPDDLHALNNALMLLKEVDAARLALAERDAEISALKVTINNMTAGLRQTRDEYEAEIAKLKADNHWPIAELPDCMMPDGAEPCDGFKSLQAELVETRRQLQQAEEELTRFKTPGSLSGKLNPFPERLPATQATEIAEKLIRAYLLDVGAGMDDFTQHEVEFSEKIAAAIGAAAQAPASSGASALAIAEGIAFQHVHWDGGQGAKKRAVLSKDIARAIEAAEARASQAPPPSASALAIAEWFRLFFQRPYPMSEEGVEHAVQSLAEAIEAAIGRDKAAPGVEGPVRIWSGEHNAYWRPNSRGYTVRAAAAWLLPRAEAVRRTSHCGPEKMIDIQEASDIEAAEARGVATGIAAREKANDLVDTLTGRYPMAAVERADFVLKQMLDGLTIGDGNREQVRSYLASHFDAAAAQEIENAIAERDAEIAT